MVSRSTCQLSSLSRVFRPQGFALVVAMSLMAMILLLMIGLSTLVFVEVQSASQTRKQDIARQNAVLGLQVALGQLQSLAGPDQRITAPAGLPHDTTAVQGSRHWTGVWQSRERGGQANNFLGWLVSGTEAQLAASAFPATATAAEAQDWVTLLGSGSVDRTDDQVRVPSIPITQNGSPTGHYAYWVAEEATKARVNLFSSTQNPHRLGIPRFAGLTFLDSDEETFFGDFWETYAFNGQEGLDKISRPGEITLLDDRAQDPIRQHFHDLTTVSRGLLTNARTGGIRHDLTHLFEHQGAFTRKFGNRAIGDWDRAQGGRYVFQPEPDQWGDRPSLSSLDLTRRGAPNWGTLRSYYNLVNEPQVGNNLRYFFTPEGISTPNLAYRNASNHDFHNWSQITPVVSWYQMGIGVTYLEGSPDDDGNPTYHPRILMRPVVALYNPYDLPFRATDYRLEVSHYPEVTIAIDAPGYDPVSFRISRVIPSFTSSGDEQVRFRWILRNVDLLPGETRYYTMASEVHLDTGNRVSHMTTEWTLDGGYYVEPTRDPLRDSGGNLRFLNPLSDAEKNNLMWSGTPEARPGVAISISYDDSNVRIWFQAHGGALDGRTFQYFHTAYQNVGAYTIPSSEEIYYDDLLEVADPTLGGDFNFGLRTAAESHRIADWDDVQASGDRDVPHRMLVDANIRAIASSAELDGYTGGNGLPLMSGWVGRGFDGSSLLPPQIVEGGIYADRGTGYFGSSRGPTGGSPAVVLFHVPREKPGSLGLLQHANLGRYTMHPSYILGNSYATSRVPLGNTAQGRSFDWSYIVNQNLWDDYYFSTLPQNLTLADWQAIRAGNQSLPNPRLSLYHPDWLDETDIPDLLTNSAAPANSSIPETHALANAMLTLEGPFNVNSVSVPAWKAFLGSHYRQQVPLYNTTLASLSGSGISTGPNWNDEDQVVFSRTPAIYGGAFDTGDSDPSFWSSYRRLSNQELQDLASAVVEEVKARGPFSSISDFINRRLEGPDDQRRRGALQAALDKTINRNLNESLVGSPAGSALRIPDISIDDIHSPEDRPGTAAPGWITQADVLQILGPLVTVRSDTFTIRAYGDSVNPLTGRVDSRAWCEAVVQRFPEPVGDGANPALADLVESPHTLGRGFRLVSFRWLNHDEI